MLSALASIYDAQEEEGVARLLKEVVDPAGTFYRFGMAKSVLRRKRTAPVEVGAR
jgi:F420-non-reducing hydrogenase small subunit